MDTSKTVLVNLRMTRIFIRIMDPGLLRVLTGSFIASLQAECLTSIFFNIQFLGMKLKTKIVRIELAEPVEFEWDEWNIRKNQIKHKVSANEAEEVLNDPEKKIFRDVFHSRREKRLIVIGSAKNGRTLHIVFTLRSKRVKVISARDLNRKEKYLYI